MAHITLELIGYRLGEAWENMAAWFTDDLFGGRVDILDIVFVGWIAFAALVVGFANFFNRIRETAEEQLATRRTYNEEPLIITSQHKDTAAASACKWLNVSLHWFTQNYNSIPNFLDRWLVALNEHASSAQDVCVRFEGFQPGSSSPKITCVSATEDNSVLRLRVGVEADQVGLVCAAGPPGDQPREKCNVTLSRLRAQVAAQVRSEGGGVVLTGSFEEAPAVDVAVTPVSGSLSQNTGGVERVRNVVAAAVAGAALKMALPGGTPCLASLPVAEEVVMAQAKGERLMAARPQQQQRHSYPVPLDAWERKLLVKVVKASGLGHKDFGVSDPYCLVELDEPLQRHLTSVVKNTNNPFWDEHFLFDLSRGTSRLSIEVRDRDKPSGEDYLGDASITYGELKQVPTSRQILPLLGPDPLSPAQGSVTLECMFLDPAEARQYMQDTSTHLETCIDDVMVPVNGNTTAAEIRKGREEAGDSASKRISTHGRSRGNGQVGPDPDAPRRGRLISWDAGRTDADQDVGGSEPNYATMPKGQTKPPDIEVSPEAPEPQQPRKRASFGHRMKERFRKLRPKSRQRARSAEPQSRDSHLLSPDESHDAHSHTESMRSERSAGAGSDVSGMKRSSGLRGSLRKLFSRQRKRSHTSSADEYAGREAESSPNDSLAR